MSISDDEMKGENEYELVQQPGQTAPKERVRKILLALVVLLAIWGAFDVSKTAVKVSRDIFMPRTCRVCGYTPEEAYERGCRWQSIVYRWMPPDCYDGELVDEFDVLAKNFGYFLDAEGKEPVSYDEFRKLQGKVVQYTSWDQHITHCIFSWLSLYRAHTMGVAPLWAETEVVQNEHHIRHCLTAIRDPIPPAMRKRITTVIAPAAVGDNYTKPIWNHTCVSESNPKESTGV